MSRMSAKPASPAGYAAVHGGIVDLLQAAHIAAARNVNALMTASYWEIGRRIVQAEQKGKRRAGYGEQLIERLADDLTNRFGRGFSARNLEQMRQFFLTWRIPQTVSAESSRILTASGKARKVQTPSAQSSATAVEATDFSAVAARFPLPWSAYVRLLSVRSDQARRFYEGEALRNRWSVRQLDRQIGSQFFERTALSRNEAAMLAKGAQPRPEDAVTIDAALKDPYALAPSRLRESRLGALEP